MFCPCNKEQAYDICCARFHIGSEYAPTAETLMRSRYSAFFFKKLDYLIETHHIDYRKDNEKEYFLQSFDTIKWLHLEVVRVFQGDKKDNTGMVEFKAQCIENEILCELHARSNFVKEQNVWFYTDDNMRRFYKIKMNRNAPCWCGSKKKYKNCHGARV